MLDYCASDGLALERLLPACSRGSICPARSSRPLHGRGCAMEFNGVPIDVPTLELLRSIGRDIQDDLIRAIDVYGVYDGRTSSPIVGAISRRTRHPLAVLESGRSI